MSKWNHHQWKEIPASAALQLPDPLYRIQMQRDSLRWGSVPLDTAGGNAYQNDSKASYNRRGSPQGGGGGRILRGGEDHPCHADSVELLSWLQWHKSNSSKNPSKDTVACNHGAGREGEGAGRGLHQGEGMGKRGASSAWEGVHSLPGHGNGLGGRQQHISLVPAEGDQGHLVSACIGLPQQPHGSALHSKVGCCWCQHSMTLSVLDMRLGLRQKLWCVV